MPPPAPTKPPPRKMVRELNTPNQTDGFYTELVNRQESYYQGNQPMKRGTPYSSAVGGSQRIVDLFPNGLWFTKEVRVGSEGGFGDTDNWAYWIWSSDTLAESASNAEIGYMEEVVAFPTFDRVYTVRRELYQAAPAVTVRAPLTALIGVNITAAGTGYTTASGTVGNASVVFVCAGGALISAIVTVEGDTITSGTSLTITGDGTGATATAIIQPASAVLVAQKKVEFDEGNPLSHEFVQIIRHYATLPGPVVTWDEYDEKTGTLVAFSRQVVAYGTAGSNLNSAGVYTAVTPINGVIEMLETRTVINKNAFPRSYGVSRKVDDLPMVLTTFTPVVFDDTNGNIVLADFYAVLTNYNYVHDVTVTEDWSNVPFTGLSASKFVETGFHWITPFGGGEIPPCLHPDLTVKASCSSGTVPAGYGRFYGAIAVSWTSAATSPTALSGTITLIDTQIEYKGGWLRHTETISI